MDLLETELQNQVSPYLYLRTCNVEGKHYIHVFGDGSITKSLLETGAKYIRKKGYSVVTYGMGNTSKNDNEYVDMVKELERHMEAKKKINEKRKIDEEQKRKENIVSKLGRWCEVHDKYQTLIYKNGIDEVSRFLVKKAAQRSYCVSPLFSDTQYDQDRNAYRQFQTLVYNKIVQLHVAREIFQGTLEKVNENIYSFTTTLKDHVVELEHKVDEWLILDIKRNNDRNITWIQHSYKGHSLRSIGIQIEKYGIPPKLKHLHIPRKSIIKTITLYFVCKKLSQNKVFRRQLERWRHTFWMPGGKLCLRAYNATLSANANYT